MNELRVVKRMGCAAWQTLNTPTFLDRTLGADVDLKEGDLVIVVETSSTDKGTRRGRKTDVFMSRVLCRFGLVWVHGERLAPLK
jgi:hypothetical protein